MFSEKLKNKIIKQTIHNINIPKGKNKHFSFLLYKNRIVSVGYNNYYKFHPESRKLGYGPKSMHSELDALINFKGNKNNIRKCTLVNVRINRFFKLGISKPCGHCMHLIKQIGLNKVYFTDHSGELVKL